MLRKIMLTTMSSLMLITNISFAPIRAEEPTSGETETVETTQENTNNETHEDNHENENLEFSNQNPQDVQTNSGDINFSFGSEIPDVGNIEEQNVEENIDEEYIDTSYLKEEDVILEDDEVSNLPENEEEMLLMTSELVDETVMLTETNLTTSMRSALPQENIEPSEFPITADGISIEKATVRWKSVSTGQTEPAKFDDLVLVPATDTMPNQQWQLDFALSGKGYIEAGDLEIVIPAYIWKTRDGKEPGRLTLAIPEEPSTSKEFAWKRVGDTYVITNTKKISAATKYMIQGTYRMTYPDPNSDKPFTTTYAHEMNDIDTVEPAEYMGVSDWFYANIMILTPHNQEEINARTNSIRATVDTKVAVTSSEKKVVNKDRDIYLRNVPSGIDNLLPENPEDYYYVKWYVGGTGNGNQPYNITLTDTLTDNYNGIFLGFTSGENQTLSERSGSVDIYSGSSFNVTKSTYAWTAYPKSSFPEENKIYTVTNQLVTTVTGVDDLVLSSMTTNASASFRAPITWRIEKVWEYNEDKYDTPLEQRMALRPEETPVWLTPRNLTSCSSYNYSGNVFRDKLNDENNWYTEWTDDGIVRDYDAYEYNCSVTRSTHGTNGVSTSIVSGPLGDRIYLPDGSSYQKYWWYDHHKTDYDVENHKWTFYNDYHEGITWTYPTFSNKRATNHLDDLVRATSDRDLVLLRDGKNSTELTYTMSRTLPVIAYTMREGGDEYNQDDLKVNTVRLEMVDHSEYFADRKLSPEEYHISFLTMNTSAAKDWVPTDVNYGTFTDQYNLATEIYGLVNNNWVRYATIDTNGVITPENGATLSGRKLLFNNENVKQTKAVAYTNGAIIYMGYDIGVVLHPSEAIVSRINSLFEVSDYIMEKNRNVQTTTLYEGDTNTELDTVTNSATSYLHGRNYRLAVDLDKKTAFTENNREERNLRFRNTITLNRVSNITNSYEFNQAVNEKLLADSDTGTFYDLLPPGMRVDESSIKAESNVTIQNVNIIENYKDSGSQLLIIKADLQDKSSVIRSEVNSAKYRDETHPTYRNQTAYGWSSSVISFDMTYSYDEARNRGLSGLRNNSAYIADEENFGDMKYWKGEKNVPSGENHKESLNEIKEKDRALMSNLSNSTTPNTVYAGANATLTEVDFSALTHIVKHASITGSDEWNYGHDNEINVPEGGKYSYRITLTSGSDTTTKDIIILDALENYVPVEVTDSGDSDIPVGKIISQREFNETNEIIEMQGGNLIQGENAWAWKGYFNGIDVSEIRALGVDAKIYYSTKANINVSDYNDDGESDVVLDILNNSGDWSLQAPSDLSTVTAIAIDCRKKADGSDFELKEHEGLIAYIHMKAPNYQQAPDAFGVEYQNFLNNAHAFNNVYMDVTQIDDVGATTHSYDHFDFTQVGIYGSNVEVIKVWDDHNDNDRIRPATLDVELLANGEGTGRIITLNAEGNWQGVFEHVLEFDDNGDKISYSISETVNDYISSYKKETDGNITTITATNKHDLYQTEYPFIKQWHSEEPDGWKENMPNSLVFRLYADGVFTGKTMTVTGGKEGDWTATFKNLQKFKDGELIQYSVEEVVPSSDWVVEYDGNIVKNTYYPYGDLKIEKSVVNATEQSKINQFTFIIKLMDKNNEPLLNEYEYLIYNENDEEISSGKIMNGGEISIKEGQYIYIKDIPSGAKYTIEELPQAGYSVTNKKNTDGRIVAGTPSVAAFTNTYYTSGSNDITGNKQLTGRTIARGQFRFTLHDENDEQIRTASNQADGSFSFGNINFSNKDNGKEFTYTVKETDRGRSGYTYDSNVYTVKMWPVDNGDGTMTVTKKIFKNEEEIQNIEFFNEYHASGETILRAWKTLEARNLQNEEFEFELIDEENNVIDTKKNSADGSVVFDALYFDETDIGKTYYYAIKEKLGDDPTVNYDRGVFGYAVTVLDNGDGTLSISQGAATPILGEFEEIQVEQGDVFAKYAVSIWGVEQDILEDGSTAGLTFGPAIGEDYTNSFKSHTPSGVTSNRNAHRCVHDDDWNTIIHWNNVDPYVYEQCIAENCTHSVELHEAGETIVNPNFEAKGTGDGPSALYDELLQYDGSTKIYENLRWHPNNNMPNDTYIFGTNYGGWGASRVRAMLNGADSLTDLGDGTTSKPGGIDIYGSYANSDIHKSASIYTNTNNLLACFPKELQTAIGKRATKYDSVHNDKTEANLKTSYDKLWLLSTAELNYDGTSAEYSHPLEGTVYQKFIQNSHGIHDSNDSVDNYYKAFMFNNNFATLSSSSSYWLRSSNGLYNGYVLVVTTASSLGGDSADNGYAISPAFALSRNANPSIDEQLPPIIDWETEDAELPIFKNTLNPGSLSVGKKIQNSEDKNKEFKFKVKLIGPNIGNQQFEFERSLLPYNVSLKYNANGGKYADDATENEFVYLVKDGVSTLISGEYEEPTREGYAFGGWYEDAEFTQEFTGNPEELQLTENKTVYAKWEEILPTTKYAVQIYDIGQDENRDGEKMGLTFGPALGQDFMNTYISHTPSGLTKDGNEHRCVHDDTWEEIVYWNNEDPYVYEQCVAENCTHSVNLTFPDYMKNTSFVYGGSSSGDGVGTLYNEFSDYCHRTWNPINNDAEFGTNKDGWGASRIRAMMNGYDELTMLKGSYSYYSSPVFEILPETNYTPGNTLIDAFPQILQNNIGTRKTLYDSVYNQKTEANLKTTYDKLWLLSPNEMSNSLSDEHPLEVPNGKYQKFIENNLNVSFSANNAFRAFEQSSATSNSGTSGDWWLRSSGDGNDCILAVYWRGNMYSDGSAASIFGVSPCFALDTTYEFIVAKYAVSLMGIGVDKNEDDITMGLTFGPATGDDANKTWTKEGATDGGYINAYKSHTPTGTTTDGNAHRCLHNDDWETIIYWNNVDPYVYEQCINENCTHSVELHEAGETILNPQFEGISTGDGPSQLFYELLQYSGTTEVYENLRWHPNNNMPNNTSAYGTVYGGWGASRIRAMLNGADSLTDLGDGTATKEGGTDVYSDDSDIHKSASVYTSTNNLLVTFPQELQDAIGKRATKYDSVYNSKILANLKISYDKLWLLSHNEIWSKSQNTNYYYTHPLEGNQYARFVNGNRGGASSATDGSQKPFNKTYKLDSNTGDAGFAYGWWWRSSGNNGNNAASVLGATDSGKLSSDYAKIYSGVAPCFSLDTTYEFPRPVTTKYAVQIYGIEQDTLEDGSTAGLTFGPALGQDFMNTYISHTPGGNTSLGNEHRCVHNDDWETIIHWNNVDPYVYEQCVVENCTHSVELTFPDYMKNTSFVYGGSSSGDGVGTLYNEFNDSYHRSWNPINNGTPYGTNKDGWGASRIRAMMNGTDSLTMTKGSYSYYNSSIENIPETNYIPGNRLLDAFPQILQDNIGARKTLYDSVYNSKILDNLKTSYDKLWLLSPNEMADSVPAVNYNHPLEAPNGKYQKFVENNLNLYSSNNAFRAYKQDGNTATSGEDYYWWLRSSFSNGADDVLYVNYDGGITSGDACYSYRCVSPCFSLARQSNTSSASQNKADDSSDLLADYGTGTAKLETTNTENQIISNQNANAFSLDIHNISEKLSSVFIFNNIVHAEDTEITFVNGEAEFTLKANEKITFKDIPAGTAYQVWEETPDGWIIYEQKHTSGEIKPLETSEAEITNRYQPGTTSVQFNGSKTLDNVAAAEGSFQFELLEDGTVLQTVSVLDGGFIQFAPITYDSAGTHNYIIQEVDPNNDKLDWDIHKENIKVVITDDGSGNLSSEVTYDSDGIVFANKSRPGTLEIKKQADIITPANKDDVFTFKITLENANGVPLSSDENIYWYRKDANGNIIDDTNLLGKFKAFFTGEDTKMQSSEIGGKNPNNNENNEGNTSAVNEEDLLVKLGLVKKVYAEEGDIASGVYDGVNWRVTATGELIIGKEGEVQEFRYKSSRRYNEYPWYITERIRRQIKSVKFAGVVKGNGDMNNMFGGSYATTFDLTLFDTSNITNMNSMFSASRALTLDLSSFDTSKVTDMGSMFSRSQVTSIIFPENFGSAATSMRYMFSNSPATTLDLTNFNTSNVTNMESMFEDAEMGTIDLSSFDTSKVTNMASMFKSMYNYSKKNTIIFPENFGSAATDMSGMFYFSEVVALDLSSFNTANVTNMKNMFSNCSSVTELDLSSFDTTKVTDMSWMFSGCYELTSLNISNFNTSNVTDMSYMFFEDASLINIVGLNNFDTSNVTNMEYMFDNTEKLESLDLSSFNTSKVTNMHSMFNYSKVTSLDLSSFDTSNVTDMSYMFNHFQVTSLDLSSFDTSKVTSSASMFSSNGIEKITIGENFFSSSSIDFPSEISDSTNYYTEKWIKSDGSFGPYTPSEIKQYFTEDMVGTWEREVSHINFDANGGYILPGYQTVYSDKALKGVLTPSENAIYRSHYKFKGWSKIVQETTIAYQPGSVAPNSYAQDSPTLYAVWEYDGKNQINVNHYQETTDGNNYSLVETETIRDVPGAEYSPNLKSYSGFHVISSVETVIIDDEELVTVNYYYNRNKYNIKFDGNSSTSGQIVESINVIGGVSTKLTKNTFSKKGAIFTGWNTKPDGTGQSYLDEQEVINIGENGENIVLYAKWKENNEIIIPSDGAIYVQCKAGESVVIPDLPNGTTYKIEEINLPDGWTLDNIVNDTGSISSSITSLSTATNKYKARGEAYIEAHKSLVGDTVQAEQFSFNLLNSSNQILQTKYNLEIDYNDEIAGSGDESIPNNWKGTAPVMFDVLEFDESDIGRTFRYYIEETVDSDNRIIYDTHKESVTVQVSDAGGGILKADVTYDNNGSLFTNLVKEGKLSVSKEIANETENALNKEFEFEVRLKDSNGNELSGEYPVAIYTKDYSAEVQSINEKAYSYTQNIDSSGNKISNYGNSWNNNHIRGTGRETASSQAHVVTIDGAEKLNISIKYGGESASYDYVAMWKGAYPSYTAYNNSSSSITGRLGGGNSSNASNTKEYEVEGDTVTFSFRSDSGGYGDGYGYYAVILGTGEKVTETGKTNTTVSNGGTVKIKGGEHFEISGLPHGATYEIIEKETPGWTLLESENTTGTITAAETSMAIFKNIYSSSGGATLEVTKELIGGTLTEDQFEFNLVNENGEILDTKSNDRDGKVTFNVYYTQEEIGNVYAYYIREIKNENMENIKWDEHVAEYVVEITDDGEGNITPIIQKVDEETKFRNTQLANLKVSKIVEGNMGNKSEEFDFILKISNQEVLADGITFVKTKSDGSVEKGNIETLPYEFKLSHGDNIEFIGLTDNSEYEVVEVKDINEAYRTSATGVDSFSNALLTNEFSAKVTLDGGGNVEITNRVDSIVPTEIRVKQFTVISTAIISMAFLLIILRRKKKLAD